MTISNVGTDTTESDALVGRGTRREDEGEVVVVQGREMQGGASRCRRLKITWKSCR